MKIWTISNQKGGVGKTTTAATLGGLLSDWGFRVLLVDLDPHASLTSHFGLDSDQPDASSFNLFKDARQGVAPRAGFYIHQTKVEGLSIIPAAAGLASVEREGSDFDGRGLVLARALEGVRDDFDYVLVDSPPLLGVLMINALAACNRLIIPVQTEFLALQGLQRMVATLKMIYASRKYNLDYVILATMYDQRTGASVESWQELRNQYSSRLWDAVIPVDTKLRDASRIGLPASKCQPRSRAVAAYTEFLQYLLRSEPADKQEQAVL